MLGNRTLKICFSFPSSTEILSISPTNLKMLSFFQHNEDHQQISMLHEHLLHINWGNQVREEKKIIWDEKKRTYHQTHLNSQLFFGISSIGSLPAYSREKQQENYMSECATLFRTWRSSSYRMQDKENEKDEEEERNAHLLFELFFVEDDSKRYVSYTTKKKNNN